MRIELDHLFVCTAPGAPEAEQLVQFGLREGAPNQHPGQGTANRRFDFANAMLELLWVSDEKEAQSDCARPTLLWERWSRRDGNASPFGICLRPADSQDTSSQGGDWQGPDSQDGDAPFPAWEYRPPYLPDPLCMHISDAGVQEPMWVYLNFMRRLLRERHFVGHPIGVREITGLTLTTPVALRSGASQKIIESGVLSTRQGATPLLEIEFDGSRQKKRMDFRPHLPLVFHL
jgi:hypothetical protein